MSKRKFATVSQTDLELYRHPSFATKTVYATNSIQNQLKEYFHTISGDNNSTAFDGLTKIEMNELLEKFYMACRTNDDSEYKSSSLTTMRQNLCRSLKQSHDYDIVNDDTFKSSNAIFINKLKYLKKNGYGSINHHADISEPDLKKIVATLSTDNPKELQLYVWFNLQIFFCRRGMENLELLKKDHYEVSVVNGKNILRQTVDEMSKNHRENDTSRSHGSVIEEQNNDKCPVAMFLKYLSKLDPRCPYLWQIPRKNLTDFDGYWYERKAGVKSIQCYMKTISQLCGLSTTYTNHCVRATTCTLLGKHFSDINVQSISGHKSLSGLSHYKRIDDATKIKMTNTLSQYLNNEDVSQTHQHDHCCISFGANSQETAERPIATHHIVNEVATSSNYSIDSINVNELLITESQKVKNASPNLNSQITAEMPIATQHIVNEGPTSSNYSIDSIDVNDLLITESRKVENASLNVNSFFQGCTINNVVFNFNSK
jgi:hypothetical protein